MSGTIQKDAVDALCWCQQSEAPQPVYQANSGNDIGFSTVGKRVGKFTGQEWAENNIRYDNQTTTDIIRSGNLREKTDAVIKRVAAELKRNQDNSTKRIKERLIDVNFWKTELERQIQDMLDETDCLLNRKKRLENALSSLEIARHIATDNLNCRDRRYGVDRVEDETEKALLKELDLLCKVERLWKKALDSVTIQIDRNRHAKEELEKDWSNKKEADEYDTANAKLHNADTNKQFYPGSANCMPNMSTPEEWAQHSHDNIVHAEQERMASEQLRMMVDNMFDDNAKDMQRASDITQVALNGNIDSLLVSKAKMEDNLKKNCKEISEMERKLLDLKEAIRKLDDTMKVAQTRLHNRGFRPDKDFCRDAAQVQLLNEVMEISKQMDVLLKQVNDCENALKDMYDTRESLEREIACKKNTIFIDSKKVLAKRYRYPTNARFRGFNHV